MTIATGIAKQVRFQKEVTMNVAPVQTGGQLLRRTSSNLDLKKATYQSKELRPDYQIADFRHGGRSADGTISGELSVGTYGAFMATVLRQAWQAVVTTGPVALLSIAPTTGLQGTITTTGTSFLTLGFKLGDVVRMTGWATTGVTANARNFWITALTATVMTGQFLDGVTPVPTKIAGDNVTLVQAGKKTWANAVAGTQTNDSYSIEHWFSDILLSELFTGCRVSDMDIKLPATGMATIDIGMMGTDMQRNLGGVGVAYFTTPAPVSTGGILAAVNGALFMNGVQLGLVTGMDVKISASMTTGDVVAKNTRPDIFAGSMQISGQLTVYLQDATLRDLFVDEVECALRMAFTTSNAANADFIGITMDRIKVGGASKDDGEKGLIMTMPYTALLNIYGGAGTSTQYTTLSIQDSTT